MRPMSHMMYWFFSFVMIISNVLLLPPARSTLSTQIVGMTVASWSIDDLCFVVADPLKMSAVGSFLGALNPVTTWKVSMLPCQFMGICFRPNQCLEKLRDQRDSLILGYVPGDHQKNGV